MPQSRRRLESRPTDRSDACSVRAANAVPIWQTTIARKVMVVACRYAWWRGVPGADRVTGVPAGVAQDVEVGCSSARWLR